MRTCKNDLRYRGRLGLDKRLGVGQAEQRFRRPVVHVAHVGVLHILHILTVDRVKLVRLLRRCLVDLRVPIAMAGVSAYTETIVHRQVGFIKLWKKRKKYVLKTC